MKDFDNIEDWYRDELNNYNVEPDKNGWSSLAEDLDATTPLTDNNISEWYKKEVSKLEERPDFTVWDKLSTKLDTASVWDKLAVSLDRYELLIWWRNLAFKGSAVLLLLLGSYFTYNNFNNEEILAKKPALKKEVNYGFASLLSNQNTSKNTLENIYNTKKVNTTSATTLKGSLLYKTSIQSQIAQATDSAKEKVINANSGNKTNKQLYASTQEIKHYNSLSAKNLNALKLNNKRNIFTTLNLKSISEKDIPQANISSEFLVKKDNNKIIFNKKRFTARSTYGIQKRKLYIGANMGLKKQGMITQLKENNQLQNYKQKSLLDFGTNFGAIVGLVISDKLNIESNINFNSTAGYKRAYSAEGIAYDENLNLNYSSVSLLAKKMNGRSTFDNRLYSTNFFGGVYASFLRTATSDINGTAKKLDGFNKTDYGIVLGIEQDRYITKTLIVTPGIRYNQGLANIVNENSSFESARNFSIEFNIGVKYIFTK